MYNDELGNQRATPKCAQVAPERASKHREAQQQLARLAEAIVDLQLFANKVVGDDGSKPDTAQEPDRSLAAFLSILPELLSELTEKTRQITGYLYENLY